MTLFTTDPRRRRPVGDDGASMGACRCEVVVTSAGGPVVAAQRAERKGDRTEKREHPNARQKKKEKEGGRGKLK